MKMIFSFVFFALGNYALADSPCNSKITRELTLCARSNFELSDKRLNIVYNQISLKISGKEKEVLIGSQRKWIIYKEKLCKSAKNQTISGEESEIEKWTCLDDITKTRTKELKYIQSDSGMGDFFMRWMLCQNYTRVEIEIDLLINCTINQQDIMIYTGTLM